MSKQLRYRGEFLSRSNVIWRVDILQESPTPFATVGELTFEREEALVIDWKRTDKEEVICGSEATIRIESPGDRTYEDLYTIEVGRIRMDVYRNNSLYWSGTLDPEFYEEPYEKARYYVVELTFSDFGILERLKYNLSGVQTLQAILVDALSRSGIYYSSIDADTYCTTYFEDGINKANLSTLSIRSDNFYDEDAEPFTLKKAVEGILQPLALRMIQRNGKIFVYDLNGLNRLAPRRAITWDGESQTLSVDKVANNVKISFSPYSSSELLNADLEFGGEYSVEMLNMSAARGYDYYSYYPDYDPDEGECPTEEIEKVVVEKEHEIEILEEQIEECDQCKADVIAKLQEYDPDFDPQTCSDIPPEIDEIVEENKKYEFDEDVPITDISKIVANDPIGSANSDYYLKVYVHAYQWGVTPPQVYEGRTVYATSETGELSAQMCADVVDGSGTVIRHYITSQGYSVFPQLNGYAQISDYSITNDTITVNMFIYRNDGWSSTQTTTFSDLLFADFATGPYTVKNS